MICPHCKKEIVVPLIPFTKLIDGRTLDEAHNLIWFRPNAKKLSFNEAKKVYSDSQLRLPTIAEFKDIWKAGIHKVNPSWWGQGFFWSSSQYDDSNSWGFYGDTGNPGVTSNKELGSILCIMEGRD